jgi:transcriptional regulator with XRE-family HTH domain
MNSQEKEIELGDRIREFRGRARLSQDELGDRLGVSGNYISMLELGKKVPGPSLRKLFEAIEQSPIYELATEARWGGASLVPGRHIPANPLLAMINTETLIRNVADVAGNLPQVSDMEKRQAIANLRLWLDEVERRLQASSAELSEAQQIAVQAAKPGANRGTK